MDIGIVYHIENGHQFWSELEDILSLPQDASLDVLDATLRRFISFSSRYHEEYLQTKAQLDYCCELLLESDFFTFHSGRSTDLILEDARVSTNPHDCLILYKILLLYGRRQPSFFRSVKRWLPILPLLLDFVLIEMDDTWGGVAFIEGKLRMLAVELLYDLCRLQKLSTEELQIFDDRVIDLLFELVEHTRGINEEELNYGVIKVLVALNEQFMVASVASGAHHRHSKDKPREESETRGDVSRSKTNTVLMVLLRRLNYSKTFAENLIFMLNRADGSDEALCMQLLVLKMFYLLFTTSGTQEYFYTNDLCVLVDVFLRELVDLPDESESLRHTYLRVLHPLLTNTQLRNISYKRAQIRNVLQSLVAHDHIRDINPTTKRLVDRCVSAQWCKDLPPEPAVPLYRRQSKQGAGANVKQNSYDLDKSKKESNGQRVGPPSSASAFEFGGGQGGLKVPKTVHKSASAEALVPNSTGGGASPSTPSSRSPVLSRGGSNVAQIATQSFEDTATSSLNAANVPPKRTAGTRPRAPSINHFSAPASPAPPAAPVPRRRPPPPVRVFPAKDAAEGGILIAKPGDVGGANNNGNGNGHGRIVKSPPPVPPPRHKKPLPAVPGRVAMLASSSASSSSGSSSVGSVVTPGSKVLNNSMRWGP